MLGPLILSIKWISFPRFLIDLLKREGFFAYWYFPPSFWLVRGLSMKKVVDSVISLFRTDFSGRGELAERQQKLNGLMNRLMKISEEYNLAVFITNQVLSPTSQY